MSDQALKGAASSPQPVGWRAHEPRRTPLRGGTMPRYQQPGLTQPCHVNLRRPRCVRRYREAAPRAHPLEAPHQAPLTGDAMPGDTSGGPAGKARPLAPPPALNAT